MANLKTVTINTNGEYQNLATLAGITFVQKENYAIQIQNPAWLREGTDGKGFLFNSDKGYTWKCTGEDLYIRTEYMPAVINIAENSGFFLNKSNGGGGSTINNQDITITQNGSYTADEGYTGIGTATVNVPTVLDLPDHSYLMQGNYAVPFCFFFDGVMVQQRDTVNTNDGGQSGVMYAFPNEVQNSADNEIILYLKFIDYATHSSNTDNMIFSLIFYPDGPQPSSVTYLRLDLYGGYRISCAISGAYSEIGKASNQYPTANTMNYLRMTLQGSNVKLETSLDNENWTTKLNVTNSTLNSLKFNGLSLAGGYGTYPYRSIMWLEDCYCTLNGVNIIPLTTQHRSSLYNFTVSGRLLIDYNDVARNFTTTNYIVADKTFAPENDDNWEINLKIKTGTDVTTSQAITGSRSTNWDPIYAYVKEGKFYFAPAQGSAYIGEVAGTYTVLANTDYWIRLKFSGTEYTLEYSLDGINYVTDITITSSTQVSSGNFALGIQSASSSITASTPWLGYIDLKSCNILINNNIYWSAITQI